MKKSSLVAAGILGALLFSGCSMEDGQSTIAKVQDQAIAKGKELLTSLASFDQLRSLGMKVVPGEEISQPFFPVKGKKVKLNNVETQFFEFASAEEAEKYASQISADGRKVGAVPVKVAGDPHFFRSGQVIVLYVGDDNLIKNKLKEVFIQQITKM